MKMEHHVKENKIKLKWAWSDGCVGLHWKKEWCRDN